MEKLEKLSDKQTSSRSEIATQSIDQNTGSEQLLSA